LLLLPRMVPQRWANWLLGSGVSVGGIGISVSGNGGGSGSAARSAEDAAGPLLRAAAAPLLALQAMSTMGIPWLLQVRHIRRCLVRCSARDPPANDQPAPAPARHTRLSSAPCGLRLANLLPSV